MADPANLQLQVWEVGDVVDPASMVMTALPDGSPLLIPVAEVAGTPGPEGPAGPTGPEGPQGPAGGGSSIVQVGRNSGTQTNSSSNNNNATAIAGLTATLVAGHRYHLRALIPFQSAATGTGFGIIVTGPAMTTYVAQLHAQQAAAGTDHTYIATTTAIATPLISTAVAAANTTLLAVVEAVAEPSADGTLEILFRSENNIQVSVMNGAVLVVTDCG